MIGVITSVLSQTSRDEVDCGHLAEANSDSGGWHCYTHLTQFSQPPPEIDTIVIPILQMSKPKYKEGKCVLKFTQARSRARK